MVFTRAQWKYVEENRIVVSALPDQMRLIETISTSSPCRPDLTTATRMDRRKWKKYFKTIHSIRTEERGP
jgi:hypothetical protein